MKPASDPGISRLLAALPDAEWQRWLPLRKRDEMPLGLVLYESGRRFGYAERAAT